MPGDLGDVGGKASLDSQRVESLLDLVASDDELRKVFEASAKPSGPSSRAFSLQAGAPLTVRQRRHLELCARLLAVSQRLFLIKAEWALMQDPVETFLDGIDFDDEPEEQWPEGDHHQTTVTNKLSPSVYLLSPWIQRVVAPLWRAVLQQRADRDYDTDMIPPPSQDSVLSTVQQESLSPKSMTSSHFPILQLVAEQNEESRSAWGNTTQTPLLQLLGACAETFPLGECWSSSTHNNWHEFRPDDPLRASIFHAKTSSAEDASLCVFVLSCFLEDSGRDSESQAWVIKALLRLTETSCLLHSVRDRKLTRAPLERAWQRVWATMFRSDLRYVVSTKNSSSDSLGELVLALLSEIVATRCTGFSNDSFLQTNHHKVWTLPAFVDPSTVHTPVFFELLLVLLGRAGISRQCIVGRATLEMLGSNPSTLADEVDETIQKTTRFNLLLFCLRRLELALSTTSSAAPDRTMVVAVLSCILSILSGKDVDVAMSRSYRACVGENGVEAMESNALQEKCRFVCLDRTPCLGNKPKLPSVSTMGLRDLWISAAKNHVLHVGGLDRTAEGLRLCVTLLKKIDDDRSAEAHSDFVSTTELDVLSRFVRECVRSMFSALTEGQKDDSLDGIDNGIDKGTALLKRTTCFKILLCLLSLRDTLSQDDSNLVASYLVDVLGDTRRDLAAQALPPQIYQTVASDVRMILQYFMIHHITEPRNVDDDVRRQFESWLEFCSASLRAYETARIVGERQPEKAPKLQLSATAHRPKDGLSDDSDSDDGEANSKPSRKRARADSVGSDEDRRKRAHTSAPVESATKRQRGEETAEIAPPTLECAVCVASILLLLRPTVACCQVVYDGLAGQTSYSRLDDSISKIDVRGAVATLSLVVHHARIIFESSRRRKADKERSLLSYCLEIIHDIRTATRIGSSLLFAEFQDLGAVLALSCKVLGDNVSRDDIEKAIDLLSMSSAQDKRVLKMRPLLLATRLDAAITIFENGSQTLHKVFDRFFASEFVMESLNHISWTVRSKALTALGMAMRLLSKQKKIFDSIGRALQQGVPSNWKVPLLVRIFKAQSERDNGSGDVSLWKDALPSIQYSTLCCWGVVGGETSEEGIFRTCLFDCFHMAAARYDLEPLALVAVERMAILRGYRNAATMVRDEFDPLISSWLDRELGLSRLPIGLSSTVLIRRLTRCFIVDTKLWVFDSAVGSSHVDIQSFREASLADFSFSRAGNIIAIILSKTQIDEEAKGNQNSIDSPVLEELHEIIKDPDDGDEALCVGDMIREHVAVVNAYGFLLLQSKEESTRAEGSRIVQCVSFHLQDMDLQSKREFVPATLRSFLNLLGKGWHGVDVSRLSLELCLIAIKELNESLIGEKLSTKDSHELFRSGAIENLLLALYWLNRAEIDIQRERRWRVINLTMQFLVSDQGEDNWLLLFGVRFVLDLLRSDEMSCIHHAILASLREHGALLRVLDSREDEAVSYQAVGTLLQLHERCQRAILKEFETQVDEMKCVNRMTATLVPLRDEASQANVWDWNIPSVDEREYLSQLASSDSSVVSESSCSYNVACESYDLLEILLVKSKDGSCLAPLRMLSFSLDEDSRKQLSIMNEKFDAQGMVRKRAPMAQNDGTSIVSFSGLLSRFQSFKRMFNNLALTRTRLKREEGIGFQLTLDARLLLDHLSSLSLSLRKARLSDKPDSFLIAEEGLRTTLTDLMDIIRDPVNPEQIRIEASRCVGEIGLSATKKVSGMHVHSSKEGDWIFGEVDSSSLMKKFQCKCLERLVDYIRSGRVMTALAALEAAREVLSTREGAASVDLLPEGTKNILRPLVKVRKKRPKMLLPPGRHLDGLIRKTDLDIDDAKKRRDWCWHSSLWLGTEDSFVTYEDWVRNVVCALLVCGYSKGQENEHEAVQGSWHFLRALTKLCSMESDFAAFVFPGIVVDMLLTGTSAPPSPSRNKSWIGTPNSTANTTISQCFSSLLGGENAMKEGLCREDYIKTTSLVVHTVDTLRKIGQQRFLLMEILRANSNKPKPPTGLQWQGTPFGIVLHLDVVQVVKAFVEADRNASAIFYAELGLESDGLASSLAPSSRVHDQSLPVDISGFRHNGNVFPIEEGAFEASILPLLKRCFAGLNEGHEVRAIDVMNSSLQFLSTHSHWSDNLLAHQGPLEQLQHLSADSSNELGTAQLPTMLRSLEDLGMFHLVGVYADHVTSTMRASLSDEHSTILAESWHKMRLEMARWPDEFDTGDKSMSSHSKEGSRIWTDATKVGFYQGVNYALSDFQREDFLSSQKNLMSSRRHVLQEIEGIYGEESVLASSLDAIAKLEVLNELDILATNDAMAELTMSKWVESTAHQENPSNELSMAVRAAVIAIRRNDPAASQSLDLDQALEDHLWHCAQLARDLGQPEKAEVTLRRLQTFMCKRERLHNVALMRLRFEEAMVMESRGHFTEAIHTSRLVLKQIRKEGNSLDSAETLEANVLLHCGRWMAQYKVESAKTIQNDFLRPACILADKISDRQPNPENATRSASAHLALATTAASLFDSVHNRITSQAWQKKMSFLDARQALLQEYSNELRAFDGKNPKKYGGKGRTLSEEAARERSLIDREIIKLRREIIRLQAERDKEERPLEDYATLALKSFGHALSRTGATSSQDMASHVYQMVSLWFASWKKLPAVNAIVEEYIQAIPSYRFVPLTYQLFSRISNRHSTDLNGFQDTLLALVEKMCREHPYHCLLQIFALANGGRVKADGAAETRDPKVEAARQILSSLRETKSDFLHGLIESFETVSDAYFHMALSPTVKFTQQKRPNLKGIKMASMIERGRPRLDTCIATLRVKPCIFTKPPTLRQDAYYGDGKSNPEGTELIQGFSSTLSITETGIHRPKIVVCHGSKGNRFKQLVKGHDDIRQDAVMEQVFGYVNSLLRGRFLQRGGKQARIVTKSVETRLQQQLRLVTYNIVPLSPTTGVLEWVNDTIPFGDYLLDKRKGRDNVLLGAHSRYHQGEWGNVLCRKTLDSAPKDAKRAAFDEICKNFSPAFRFFFIERFGDDLLAWHTAKMKYTRSCAVSSIVGHFLGIGDRHSHNILLHEKTGEVVHIDFGIVFESGKVSKRGILFVHV